MFQMKRFFLFVLLLHSVDSASGREIQYDRDIRPLLSDACFACHGPDDEKRKADLRLDTKEGLLAVVEAGNLEDSELYQRIITHDLDDKMPPAKSARQLSEGQVQLLKDWILQCAKWEGHWAFQRVERPKLPENGKSHPVDAFVLHRLHEENLVLSPKADVRVLARRMWLDLTGLPPTPEELKYFLADPDIGRAAGKLLKSTAYAEHMTAKWLDQARYADTSGYQSDGWRTMWRWRDWVIEAYQKNMPFDQFTIEQLAGDLLPKPTLSQRIATGFNRNHRGNSEGGIIPEEFAVEYVVDRVDTTFTVWQGITIGCARCHSHKYDPITHKEYYQLYSFFNRLPEHGRALKEGNSVPWIKAPTPENTKTLAQLKKREKKANKLFQKLTKEMDPDACSPEAGWRIPDGLVATGESEDGKVAKFGYFDTFSLGARIEYEEGQQGTILSKMVPVEHGLGYYLELTKYRTVQLNLIKRWLDDAIRVETAVPAPSGSHIFATYDGTRTASSIRMYIDGKEVPFHVHLDFLNQSFDSDEPLRVGNGQMEFPGKVSEVSVYNRVLGPKEVLALAGDPKAVKREHFLHISGPEEIRNAFKKATLATRKRAAYEKQIPTVMVMEDSVDRPAYILKRGQYDIQMEQVYPGFPASLNHSQTTPKNRLDLAKWLVSRDNPLTARVIVNRIWRDIFGTGLVKTTEDFGVQGDRPSHPELLDWLAAEFMENHWDLHHLYKLIVTSQTYQQSSKTTPTLIQLDPENRLLARGPRFRLSAGTIRDQALAVSGLLANKVGGPSVKPYQPEGLWGDLASDKNYQLAKGPDLYRRSLYTFWKRTVPPPMMMNFDSAGRETCEVTIRRTNTPLQALNLMNDVTFLEAARVLAQQILETKEDRIQLAFERILQRPPNPQEVVVISKSLKYYQKRFEAAGAEHLSKVGNSKSSSQSSKLEVAAWTLICSTLLNLDEVVTKE